MGVYDISGNPLQREQVTNKWFWENETDQYYWIFHLDTDRKYFSVANIKILIDAMADAGVNQFGITICGDDAFRFQLDDMQIYANNTTYDLSRCLGGSENPNKWYTQGDMDEIISYAHKYGIDVVPTINMPGHMGKILSVFTQFKYQNYGTLNIKDQSAVNFALAIVEKYADYFASRGCKRYNVSYDEILGYAVGYPLFYNNGDFQYVVDFANSMADTIKAHAMIPRIFNEAVHYNNDPNYFVNRDYEVLYWREKIRGQTMATAQTLINMGYPVINSSQKYYWVKDHDVYHVSAETLRTANLLVDFDETETTMNGRGAMFCVWCDGASSKSDAGDNGNAIVTAIVPLIAAYGEGIAYTMSLQGSQNQS